jgi:hypothetical protein
MFQVAARSANYSAHHAVWQHDDLSPVTSPTRNNFSSADVQLPRTLQRPPYSEVSRDQISAVAPELVDVPAEYIRRTMCVKTAQYVFILFSLSSPRNLITNVSSECSRVFPLCQNHTYQSRSLNRTWGTTRLWLFPSDHLRRSSHRATLLIFSRCRPIQNRIQVPAINFRLCRLTVSCLRHTVHRFLACRPRTPNRMEIRSLSQYYL